MLTYEVNIEVKQNGKYIGDIRPHDSGKGYCYYPKGKPHLRGDIFPSIEQVKQSLEAN